LTVATAGCPVGRGSSTTGAEVSREYDGDLVVDDAGEAVGADADRPGEDGAEIDEACADAGKLDVPA
jgi:hypothetical protein